MGHCYCFTLEVLLAIGLTTTEVTISPLVQIVAANVSVMFRCSGISIATGTILINNYNYDNYFTNSGITFQNSTVTLIATKDKNNTVFQCYDVAIHAYSNTAVLIVAGPPSTPDPRVKVLNYTALELSWDEPFAQPGYGTLFYTVNVVNAVSGAPAGLYQVITNRFVFAINERTDALGCALLIFSVTATNKIGVSGGGNISSGFPVALGPSLTPPEIHVALNKTSNGLFEAEILLKFPPEICWYFLVNYTFSVTELSTGADVLYSNVNNVELHNDSFATFIVNRLAADDVYTVVTRINLVSGAIFLTNSSIEMPSYLPTILPSTVSPIMLSSIQPLSSEYHVPLSYWLGYISIALTLFGASTVLIGSFAYLRYKNRIFVISESNKSSSRQSSAVDHVDATSKNQIKVAASLVSNPIYAGAVYETIPGTKETHESNNFMEYIDKYSERKSSFGAKSIRNSSALEESCNADHVRREEWISSAANDETRYARPQDVLR